MRLPVRSRGLRQDSAQSLYGLQVYNHTPVLFLSPKVVNGNRDFESWEDEAAHIISENMRRLVPVDPKFP